MAIDPEKLKEEWNKGYRAAYLEVMAEMKRLVGPLPPPRNTYDIPIVPLLEYYNVVMAKIRTPEEAEELRRSLRGDHS